MDSDLLRTFLAVQRTRHFAQAAEQLYLTPSAVSFRIRQLETELGVSLFHRRRSNIQLTAAGERLVAHAEALLAGWQAQGYRLVSCRELYDSLDAANLPRHRVNFGAIPGRSGQLALQGPRVE